jgi:hypothetical protein
MTPEERNLVIELFDRLATLEDAQRDPEAERLIRDGLRQAPNAPYALVQTVLVQDEALKRADARIRELEGAVTTDTEPRDASFLGGMRDSLFGKREGRGSVPSVRSAEPASTSAPVSPAWPTGTQAPMPVAPAGVPGAPGGSFLGTAAAAAAGVIGGSLLMSGIRSLMGNPQGAHAAFDPASGASGSSPWSGSEELAREAGLGDIGRTPSSGDDTASRSYGALDERGNDDEPDDQGADDVDDGDFGFDDDGGDNEE